MARPKLTPGGESVRLQVVVPAALAVAVAAWGTERGVSRSEAARLLLVVGLDPENAAAALGSQRLPIREERAQHRSGPAKTAAVAPSSGYCQPSCPPTRIVGLTCMICGRSQKR